MMPGMKDESIDLLKEDKHNARRISKEALAGLKFAMEEHGDLSRITWNEELGDLVCGHQRMKVLRAAGAKTWQRVSPDEGVITNPKTGERFSIRIVRWPLEKHREAQIVANNQHLQGEFTSEVVGQIKELEQGLRAEALRLDDLLSDLDDEVDDLDEHPGLEEFDAAPRPRPTWIMMAAPEDVAAEAEHLLRGKFGKVPGVRIERSEGHGNG
jgi:ParB-like chromosome segregation protein Spo0J